MYRDCGKRRYKQKDKKKIKKKATKDDIKIKPTKQIPTNMAARIMAANFRAWRVTILSTFSCNRANFDHFLQVRPQGKTHLLLNDILVKRFVPL